MNKFLQVNQQTGEFCIWFRIEDNWWDMERCLSSKLGDIWKLKPHYNTPDDYLGLCELSDDYILNEMQGIYKYEDFNNAAAQSKELWDNYYKPNSKYKVAKYFDDYFERYISDSMDKKTAMNLQQTLRIKNNEPHIDYMIIAV